MLHHLATRARRFKACAECMRVLRPGGVALFYAWAQEQQMGGGQGGVSGHRFPAQDVLVPFHVPITSPGADRASARPEAAAVDDGDTTGPVVDAEKGTLVFQRYCHVYSAGELEGLFEPLVEAGEVAVDASWYDCGNWCAVVRKLDGTRSASQVAGDR